MNQIVNSDEKGTIDLTETVHELGDDDVVDVTQSPFDLNQEDDDIIQTNEINQDMLHVNQVEKILKEPPHIDQWEDEDEDDDYDGNLSEFSSGKEHSNTEASSETPTIETSPTSFAKKPQLTLDFLDELQDAAPSPFESPLGARYRDSYLNDLRQSITNDQSPSPSTKRLSPEVSEKFHKDKNNNNNNDAPLKFKKQKKQRKKKFKLEQPAPEEVTNAPNIENLPLCDVLVLFDIDNCSGLFVHLLDQCFDKRLIVFIFGGPALPKVPMNKLNYMAQMIAQQRLFVIMTPKSHKNSADFCLSFYAGICHNKIDSNVPFVIVSSDNAFEETAHQLKVSEPRRQTYIFGAGSHLNVELRVMCNIPPAVEKVPEPQQRNSNKKNAKQRRLEARSKKVFKPPSEEIALYTGKKPPSPSPKPSVSVSFGPL